MAYDDEQQEPRYGFFAPRLTPLVRVLLVANITVFAAQVILQLVSRAGGWPAGLIETIFGLNPHLIRKFCLWQFVTYMFVHDPGQVLHIILNMLFLYWFGPHVEQLLGRARFLALYLSAGIFAGLASFLLSDAGVVGASGAIYALLVCCAIYFPDRMIIYILFPMRLRTLVLLVLGIDLFATLTASSGNVATLAHLGGALWGYAFIRLRPPLDRLISRIEQRSEIYLSRRRRADRNRLDELLAKVSREGMQSLTSGEKRFLRRVSQSRR